MKASRISSHRLLQVFCPLLFLLPSTAQTLSTPSNLEGLDNEDRSVLETVATREPDVRDAVLLATQNVDVLVEVQRIQEQSSERFREAVEAQTEDLQQMIWDVVRVPGLLEELGTGGPRSGSELDAIVARQPEVTEDAIRTLGRSHYVLLGEMIRIDLVAWDRFDAMVEGLPEDSQQAYRTLINEPELLSTLSRRVRLAVYLGDSYRDDPEGTRQLLADLGTEVALRDAAAEEEWRTVMAEDPEAAAELERSARFYAEEHDYDYHELTTSEVTTVRTVVHHYPYWFGYPTHYANHYLYPYGYWYDYPVHLGFYFGGSGHNNHHNGHNKVYFGVPSQHYLHWYFGNHHDRHYKHLSHRFSKHHDTHRYARDHRYRTLSRWDKHKRNRDRHSDWKRSKRNQRHAGHDDGRRHQETRRGNRFFGGNERRRGKPSARFERTRRGSETRFGDGERRRTRIARREGEARRGRRTLRSDTLDMDAAERQTQTRRAGANSNEGRSAKQNRRLERKQQGEARRARTSTEARREAKPRNSTQEFRAAEASARKAKQIRRASVSPRQSQKAARKAAKRTNRQVRQTPKRSNTKVRKASHSSPRKSRVAKASRRSNKVAKASNSGRKGNGRHR